MSNADPVSGTEAETVISDFVRDTIRDDLAAGRHDQVVTRFPPEPKCRWPLP